ncbi:MAG TPA: hypothetical protein VKI62_05985 [Bacteroidota bacterium]|nr:hypothetical protein [Bacteroidota bacterium]
MSLKSFHIFFIGCAVLLAFGFGVWAFQSSANSSIMVMIGITSTLIGIGLIVYGIRFLKKLKHISFL